MADEYADDGLSGTIPLHQRPEGKRLLDDAEAGRFASVLVYRVDRLGRSLTALLDAHKRLEHAGVTVRSATEPFDTASPIGTFLFQLLGSLAELEKSTITERMMLGRDRVAKEGRWTGGPIPFGYDVDVEGYLTPSTRQVPGMEIAEADAVRDVFDRIANGSTLLAEARRFNALGVPSTKRYASGKVTYGKEWNPGRLSYMLHATVYKGIHTLQSEQGGPIEREVPALVDPVTWQRVQAQLHRNRNLPKGNQTRLYLLRGLITCAGCGCTYVGSTARRHNGAWFYYRCGGQTSTIRPQPGSRCTAKPLPALWLEDLVWQDCRKFIINPGDALAEAKRQLEARTSQDGQLVAEQQRLHQALAGKADERERILTLYRRGRVTVEDLEFHLNAIEKETADLRTALGAIKAQQDLANAYESQLTDAEAMLTRLQERLEEIERTDDAEAKRQVMDLLVTGIQATTVGTGRTKRAHITITYAFSSQRTAISDTNTDT